MGRRRQIGIAHAEVDDVGASIPRGRLGPIDLLEHVGRKAANAVKIFHGSLGSGPAVRTESRGNARPFEETSPGTRKSSKIKHLERSSATRTELLRPDSRLN